ncbi:MAG: TRL-like protein family [Desulfococcus sp. 4484_241]|nr:MAG: TRL-like protein family [Desulfococcus sp. 4484_241]
MKKFQVVCLICLLAFIPTIFGCATPFPYGSLYTEVKMPIGASANVKATKKGVAESKSILGLVATGDSSIKTAMRNGGITRISYVDWEAENILGIIGTYKTVVYGQ